MRASDRAYAALLDEIQSGALAPGAVLIEVEQAERLGVSRTPLREAVRRLVADGLVVQQSPRVTVVAGLDVADIKSLFVLRRALEEAAARLAASRPGTAVFTALAEEFGRVDLNANKGRAHYEQLLARFDNAIDEAVDNDHLSAALRTVRAHLVRVRRLARDRPQRLAASVQEHRLIAEAIGAQDGELAAHATHVHLHNALTSIVAALEAVPARLPSEGTNT